MELSEWGTGIRELDLNRILFRKKLSKPSISQKEGCMPGVCRCVVFAWWCVCGAKKKSHQLFYSRIGHHSGVENGSNSWACGSNHNTTT